jgi:hypothetical protein
LQPGVFHDAGSEEFKRFTTAAARRGETALVVSMIGEDIREDAPRNPLARYDDNILLPDVSGSIVGRRLPVGVNPHLATGVRGADRDLGLRLRNRPPDAPWWASELRPIHLQGISGTEVRSPSGVLEPILVNDLGEILAGVWVPEGTDWRWYVVPAGTDWRQIVEWLTEHAIPEFLPDALRRVRAADLVDDELLTSREIDARDAMTRFEAAAANERARLEGERETARADADPIRFGLLYGTSSGLNAPVMGVLRRAGFVVEDLDEHFGVGVSADLLASRDGRHWLVELKAAAGNPSEGLVEDLDRHLRTWFELGRNEQLSGGVLVVNHQHNRPPLDRQPAPYSRASFVSSLRHPIIPTLALFAWWRDGNDLNLVEAMTGPPRVVAVDLRQRHYPSVPTGQAGHMSPLARSEVGSGKDSRRRFSPFRRHHDP